jgi:hypothetical protein
MGHSRKEESTCGTYHRYLLQVGTTEKLVHRKRRMDVMHTASKHFTTRGSRQALSPTLSLDHGLGQCRSVPRSLEAAYIVELLPFLCLLLDEYKSVVGESQESRHGARGGVAPSSFAVLNMVFGILLMHISVFIGELTIPNGLYQPVVGVFSLHFYSPPP